MKTKLLRKIRRRISFTEYTYNPDLALINTEGRVVSKLYPIYVIRKDPKDPYDIYWSFDREKAYNHLIRHVLIEYGSRRSLESVARRSKTIW